MMEPKHLFAVCAVATAACVVEASDARACGFVYYGPKNHEEGPARKQNLPKRPPPKPKLAPVDQIAESDRLLEQGALAEAIEGVRETFPKVRAAAIADVKDPVQVRAARVMALALVRGASPSADDVAWSEKTLGYVSSTLRPNDPVAQADWAEALAKAGRADDALALLSKLAKKDLLGSAPAYAAYAKLLSARGDAAGAAAAQDRCASMTKSPAICKAPASPGRA